MLTHPVYQQLQALKLHGMAEALNEQIQAPNADTIPFVNQHPHGAILPAAT